MQFGKLHRKWQPQTGALKAAGKAVIDLAEKFERLANLIAGHPDACVPHPKAKASSIGLGLGADRNPTARRRKLDRIRKKIDKDLLELGSVSSN